MSSVRDNWERLVAATLKREKLRQIALCSSLSSSCRSDDSRSSFSNSEIAPERFEGQILEMPILFPYVLEECISLVDQVIKEADLATLFRQECMELKSKSVKLACLLLLVAHTRFYFHQMFYKRIITSEVEVVLKKVLALLLKCFAKGRKRVFSIVLTDDFRKISDRLQRSIVNVTWLLNISAGYDWEVFRGLPPFFRNESTMGLILEQIVILSMGSMEDRSNAGWVLVVLFCKSYMYRWSFIGDSFNLTLLDPGSSGFEADVDQLIIIINKAEPRLLIPCLQTIGKLAQNFREEGTKMISLLVNMLAMGQAEVDSEACATLTKFICSENKLHQHYSKVIISVGGVQHLVQLVYFGEESVKQRALTVVCYIGLHVPDSEDIAQALTVLRWAAKKAWSFKDEDLFTLLRKAEERLSP